MFFDHFLSHSSPFFYFPNIFPKIGFAISPNIGAPIDTKSPSGRPLPLCLFFAYLYLPPKYQIPFLPIVFLFRGILKKQSFLLFIYLFITLKSLHRFDL